MEKDKIDTLKTKLQDHHPIVITAHTHPDGDAVGSALALHHYLSNQGFHTQVVLPDNFPRFLKWMEGSKNILIYDNHPDKAKKAIEGAGLLFCVDYNEMARTNHMEDVLTKAKGYKIMIDHHPDPVDSQFDLVFSYPDYSSTAEIVFYLFQELNNNVYICKHTAEALYAGIMTDTGSFRFSSTTRRTFHAAAELVERGVDVALLNHRVYDTYSEKRLRLLGFCLSERLVVLPEFSTAYIYLSKTDLERFDYRSGDTEGLVNYGLSIEGINLAALFTEKNGEIRLSLRSKTAFSVNEFARAHFDGGGHERAAGASSDMSMSDTIILFRSLLPKYKSKLNVL